MKDVETLIREEKWDEARAAIRRRLRADPEDHWLLTRLGTTYYEQGRFKLALRHSEHAVELAPWCPLARWDYACGLEMLGRHDDALAVYRALIRAGVNRLATGRCGEGRARARGLVADCWVRVANCLEEQGKPDGAWTALRKHLAARGPGCESIYSLKSVVSRANALGGRLGRRPTSRRS